MLIVFKLNLEDSLAPKNTTLNNMKSIYLYILLKLMLFIILLFSYVHFVVVPALPIPLDNIMEYSEWKVGLVMFGYYFFYLFVRKNNIFSPSKLSLILIFFTITIFIASPIYAVLMIYNKFRLQTIIHLYIITILVDFASNAILNKMTRK